MIVRVMLVTIVTIIWVGKALAMSCEKEWSAISKRIVFSDIATLISEWESLSGKCQDKDLYQLRKIILKIESKDYAGSSKLIDAELQGGNKYRKELLLRGVVGITKQVVATENVASKKAAKLISYYEGIINSYPEWWEVYAEFGSFLSLIDEGEVAQKYIQRSIDLKPTNYAYGLLMNLKYKEKDYSGVVAVFDGIKKNDDSIYYISSIIYILAKSYAELEEFDLAKKSIEALVDRNKSVLQTSSLDDAIKYIEMKLKN